MLFNNTNMRTAMAYTNAVGDKVYPIIVDIKKGIKSTEEVSFVSSDINTGVLSVAFIQGNDTYNVEGAEVICSIMRPDTTTLEIPCNIINGNTVEVPLGVNGTSQDGVYSFDFKVFKGGDKIVGTPIMNYSVSLSISNDLVVEEDDRLPVLTMLITQVNELKEETRETINQSNVATESSKEATAKAIEATNNANAVSERVSQETSEAITRVDNTIVELNNTVGEKISELDNAKTDMTTTVSNKIDEVENRFNTLTSTQQQEAEVIDARDGEVSLKARLDRDLYKDGISLSDRIEAIEGLKDSQNMKYETDKGYLVCKETKNGVIDDLKIEGKTLVNLSTLRSKTLNTATSEGRRIVFNSQMFKEGREYTIILNVGNVVNGTSTLHIQWDFINRVRKFNVINSNVTNLMNSKVIYKFKQDEFPDTIKSVYLSLNTGNPSNCTCEINDCIVLEGDHTQNPPSYFEGLMSVGEDVDKIEVLSCNENLFDMDNFSIGTGSLYAYCKYPNTNGLTLSIEDRDTSVNTSGMYIGVTKIGVDASQGFYWCLSNQTIENRVIQTDFSYVSFHPNNRETIETLNKRFKISVYVGKVNKPYTPHQSDKKQILFYNENGELEPIQELHEWDSIEKHSDNKWYYHKRSGKVVLNGSENWALNSSINTGVCLFFIKPSFVKNINIVSDRFSANKLITVPNKGANVEGMWYLSNYDSFYICISSSKLSTQDVAGFKQWLQANNVTVVYQLAQEEVYELAPLHLDSYANETLILCNSGAISPKMEFSITSHINELVKSQGDRISLLEEKMYKALKQVLAGDMYSLAELLYPEDFVEENPENEIMLIPFE